jgi:hypothetical protein
MPHASAAAAAAAGLHSIGLGAEAPNVRSAGEALFAPLPPQKERQDSEVRRGRCCRVARMTGQPRRSRVTRHQDNVCHTDPAKPGTQDRDDRAIFHPNQEKS